MEKFILLHRVFGLMKKKYCIFACGGHGTRMGNSLPKQFIRIGDKTILQITLERFLEALPDAKIIIALPSEYRDFWIEECSKMSFTPAQSLVEGGITRFHSVRNALEKVPDGAIVAVHDAVRPFASVELIRKIFDEALTSNAVVPVFPVTDTVKVLDKDLKSIPGVYADRSVLFGAQTPQVFHSETLKAAYKQAYDTAFTDEASIVEANGGAVKYITGEKLNIKITTPDDLLLAGFLAGRC